MNRWKKSLSNIINQNGSENYLQRNYCKFISWKYKKNRKYNNINKKY